MSSDRLHQRLLTRTHYRLSISIKSNQGFKMTRAQMQASLFARTRLSAAAFALSFGAVTAACVVGLATFAYCLDPNLRPNGFSMSVFSVLAFGIVLLGLGSYSANVWRGRLNTSLQGAWAAYCADTKWLTPAGEAADFVSSDPLGKSINVRFAKGDVESWSVGDLTPADGRDMTSVNPRNRTLSIVLTIAIVMVLFGSLFVVDAIPIALRPAAHPVGAFALAAWLGLSASACAYGIAKFGNYEDSRSGLLRRVSVCEWKTLDGRVGKVRSAYRQSGDSEYNTDYLTLVFPDGTKKRFERPDLRPVAQAQAA
jgi:hypothetical protein